MDDALGGSASASPPTDIVFEPLEPRNGTVNVATLFYVPADTSCPVTRHAVRWVGAGTGVVATRRMESAVRRAACELLATRLHETHPKLPRESSSLRLQSWLCLSYMTESGASATKSGKSKSKRQQFDENSIVVFSWNAKSWSTATFGAAAAAADPRLLRNARATMWARIVRCRGEKDELGASAADVERLFSSTASHVLGDAIVAVCTYDRCREDPNTADMHASAVFASAAASIALLCKLTAHLVHTQTQLVDAGLVDVLPVAPAAKDTEPVERLVWLRRMRFDNAVIAVPPPRVLLPLPPPPPSSLKRTRKHGGGDGGDDVADGPVRKKRKYTKRATATAAPNLTNCMAQDVV